MHLCRTRLPLPVHFEYLARIGPAMIADLKKVIGAKMICFSQLEAALAVHGR